MDHHTPHHLAPSGHDSIGFRYPSYGRPPQPYDTYGARSLLFRLRQGGNISLEDYADYVATDRSLRGFLSKLAGALEKNTSRLVLLFTQSKSYMALGRTVAMNCLQAYATPEQTPAGAGNVPAYTLGVSICFDEVHILPQNRPNEFRRDLAIPLERTVYDQNAIAPRGSEVFADDILMGDYIKQVGRFSHPVEIARLALEGHLDR